MLVEQQGPLQATLQQLEALQLPGKAARQVKPVAPVEPVVVVVVDQEAPGAVVHQVEALAEARDSQQEYQHSYQYSLSRHCKLLLGL